MGIKQQIYNCTLDTIKNNIDLNNVVSFGVYRCSNTNKINHVCITNDGKTIKNTNSIIKLDKTSIKSFDLSYDGLIKPYLLFNNVKSISLDNETITINKSIVIDKTMFETKEDLLMFETTNNGFIFISLFFGVVYDVIKHNETIKNSKPNNIKIDLNNLSNDQLELLKQEGILK